MSIKVSKYSSLTFVLALASVLAAGCASPSADDGDGTPATRTDGALAGGAEGAQGAPGTAGSQGTAGAQGPVGAAGPKGDQGAAGPTGVVSVLGFDVSDFAASLPGSVNTVPVPCRTAAYVAGPNETAVIDMDVSVFPASAPAVVVSLKPAASLDGAAFVAISKEGIDSLTDGVASPSVTKSYPLVAGTSYVFGTQIFSALPTGPLTKSTCHGTVLVVRLGA